MADVERRTTPAASAAEASLNDEQARLDVVTASRRRVTAYLRCEKNEIGNRRDGAAKRDERCPARDANDCTRQHRCVANSRERPCYHCSRQRHGEWQHGDSAVELLGRHECHLMIADRGIIVMVIVSALAAATWPRPSREPPSPPAIAVRCRALPELALDVSQRQYLRPDRPSRMRAIRRMRARSERRRNSRPQSPTGRRSRIDPRSGTARRTRLRRLRRVPQ